MSQFVYGSLNSDCKAVAIIMAGGIGTRFWPLSRKAKPKQYLPLADEEVSLIQATANRLEPLFGTGSILVVTSESQVDLVQEQLPSACILAEPSARNTAACVAVASRFVLDKVGDVPIVCLPADHVISGQTEIEHIYADAIQLANESSSLLTVGIKPTRPETGYGYIESGERSSAELDHGSAAFKVKSFVEKPDLETAQQYVSSGSFYWNSGMFCWRPSVILSEIERQLPEMLDSVSTIAELFDDKHAFARITELYNVIQSVSIDVGILENALEVVMLSGDSFKWSDVGSWHSWVETASETEADTSGNILRGDVIAVDTKNSACVSSKRLVAVVGLEDIVVVDTEDALLVCHRDKAQQVKEVVEHLKSSGRSKLL